jgi:hypothetical protein
MIKVKDEQQWIMFRHHVRDNGNPGMRKLLDVFEEWTQAVQSTGSNVEQYNHHLCQMDALPILKAGDICELFVLAIQFWPNGEEFYESLTPLECKIVQENLDVKVLALQEMARKAGQRADRGLDSPAGT